LAVPPQFSIGAPITPSLADPFSIVAQVSEFLVRGEKHAAWQVLLNITPAQAQVMLQELDLNDPVATRPANPAALVRLAQLSLLFYQWCPSKHSPVYAIDSLREAMAATEPRIVRFQQSLPKMCAIQLLIAGYDTVILDITPRDLIVLRAKQGACKACNCNRTLSMKKGDNHASVNALTPGWLEFRINYLERHLPPETYWLHIPVVERKIAVRVCYAEACLLTYSDTKGKSFDLNTYNIQCHTLIQILSGHFVGVAVSTGREQPTPYWDELHSWTRDKVRSHFSMRSIEMSHGMAFTKDSVPVKYATRALINMLLIMAGIEPNPGPGKKRAPIAFNKVHNALREALTEFDTEHETSFTTMVTPKDADRHNYPALGHAPFNWLAEMLVVRGESHFFYVGWKIARKAFVELATRVGSERAQHFCSQFIRGDDKSLENIRKVLHLYATSSPMKFAIPEILQKQPEIAKCITYFSGAED